jgi:hypothetical protein
MLQAVLIRNKGPVTQDGTGKSKAKKSNDNESQNSKGRKHEKGYILTNNVIYAIRLEYGWSRKQARLGWYALPP